MTTPPNTPNPLDNLPPHKRAALALFQEYLGTVLNQTFAKVSSNKDSANNLNDYPSRIDLAFTYFREKLAGIPLWLLNSRETTNFTYDLSDASKQYLAHIVAAVTQTPLTVVKSYIAELDSDTELHQDLRQAALSNAELQGVDPDARFGRRMGWYAVVRAVKPRVVVETGVDKGLGSMVLARALQINEQEGAPGKYYGTDINPQAGCLFTEKYQRYGKILYGDSIQSINNLQERVDVFINDSDHSAEYEGREYLAVNSKLSQRAILLGDNSHSTQELVKFAESTNRRFLFFSEQPKNHWYPGAGIGFAY